MTKIKKTVALMLVASGAASVLQANCGDNLGVFYTHAGPGYAAGGGNGRCYYSQVPLQERGRCESRTGNNCDIQGETVYGYAWWAPGDCGNAQTAVPLPGATSTPYSNEKAGPTNGACPPGA